MGIDVTKKSVGTLIDELITTDIKCFMAQEKISKENPPKMVANYAIQAQELNKRRNSLIRAIDSFLNQEALSPTEKTY